MLIPVRPARAGSHCRRRDRSGYFEAGPANAPDSLSACGSSGPAQPRSSVHAVSPELPRVDIEEIPSGVRTITGVATSITAFIGRAPRGEVDRAGPCTSFAEYSRLFGGLSRSSTMSYAVSHFFQHGGRDALIVRVFNGDADTDTATITLATTSGNLVLEAASPGTWGNRLRARVNHLTRDTSDTLLFNLTVEELRPRRRHHRSRLGTVPQPLREPGQRALRGYGAEGAVRPGGVRVEDVRPGRREPGRWHGERHHHRYRRRRDQRHPDRR